jgi:[ribosomal protein S5]-alanine N-acetyltransferase
MEIETERLLLREFTKNDWQAVFAYASLGSVARFMSFGPFTAEDARRFVRNAMSAARRHPRLDHVFAVVPKGQRDPVGVVHLGRKTPEAQEAEVSFALHPNYWGQGFVPEAARAMLSLGFETLGLHRIYAECHPDNRASSRAMEKIGMRHEGDFRQKRWIKGCWWDISHYAILEFEHSARASGV